MGRVTHVCVTCAEHFTRKYSATRHNITVHGNRGEIVPLLEYLVGRYCGRIPASNPFWYSGRHSKKNRIYDFGRAIAVRSNYIGDTSYLGGWKGQYHQQLVMHVCVTCAEHFTTRYSASRHNLALHCNRGEIVPLLEYLAGRASGRYQASHPSLYRRSKEKRIYEFGYATAAADSVGDTFRPAGLQGQYDHQQLSPSSSSSTIHDQPPDVLPYPTDQSQSAHTADDYGTLSEETRLKIEELKKRIYRYAQYHPNPVAVINCIIYYCNNGDNTLLDEKLEQLRSIDAISRY
jgi:hypothetical protein